jgi:hypothetical protein
MVAEHQMRLYREIGKACRELPVGEDIAALGEIAADHHERRIAVQPGNIAEAGIETFKRIEAPEPVAPGHEMEIAYMDEFHAFTRPTDTPASDVS